jgi:hypothetical protein
MSASGHGLFILVTANAKRTVSLCFDHQRFAILTTVHSVAGQADEPVVRAQLSLQISDSRELLGFVDRRILRVIVRRVEIPHSRPHGGMAGGTELTCICWHQQQLIGLCPVSDVAGLA